MFDRRRARRSLGLVPLALLASSLGSAAASWAADGDYLGRGLAAFDAGGSYGDAVGGVAVQPDGKVVLVGTALYDFDLGVGTHADLGTALAFDRDGRLVVGGTVEYNGFDTDFGWARFDNSYVFADGFEWGSTGPWSSAP